MKKYDEIYELLYINKSNENKFNDQLVLLMEVIGVGDNRLNFIGNSKRIATSDRVVVNPTKVYLPGDGIKKIIIGNPFSQFIYESGVVYNCGVNKIGPSMFSHLKPSLISIDNDKISDGVTGDNFIAYITYDGEILIYDNQVFPSIPYHYHLSNSAKKLFCSPKLLCVVDNKGDIYVFDNGFASEPTKIPIILNVVDIAMYWQYLIFLDDIGKCYKYINQKLEPIQSLENHTIIKLSCWNMHVLALDSEGRVFSAGSNDYGELGISSNESIINTFSQITTISHKKIVHISAGDGYSLFVSSEGQLFSCGINNFGQLMLGYVSKPINCPKVATIDGKVVGAKAGVSWSFAIINPHC